MKSIKWALMACLLLAVGSVGRAQTPAQATRPAPDQKPILAWASKADPMLAYDNINRLVWRLSDIVDKHKGESDWSETVVNNRDTVAQWIANS